MDKKIKSGIADAYKNYFNIGAAINPELLSFGSELIRTEFNSITCENEMKFSSVHPTPGKYTFDRADTVFNFALSNNMKMRGHTLVWHNQTGSWLFENDNGEKLGKTDKEILYSRMKEHIHMVVKRYAGKVYCWDVVNEAISDSDSENEYLRTDSPYYQISESEEYIEKAFAYAHEADSDALLFYNDYSTEVPAKREKIYRLLKSLINKGVPVHGIGLQAHYNICCDVNELRKSIDLFSSLGLTVQITELDISVYKPDERGMSFSEPPADRINSQTELYGEIFALLREKKDKISGVTFWGLTDNTSWLNTFPEKRNDYPLLFDANQKPKEAYGKVVDFAGK
ncbi:MAG: endo-1,4-beta-xylanase [Oscillospiraceae bacterium]|nr:endo-1,4-beta-xylanase [Oscillospiraceae bacterium]